MADDDGVRVVAGLGDVDVDETIAAARSAAPAAHLADVAVPDGFEEVAVPTDQGTVRYEDTQVTIGFSTVRPGGEVDAAAAAFMAPGRDGPISRLPGEDAWLTTTFGGHPTAVVAVGTDGLATIVGLPGTDVASLVPNTTVVPARDVTIANPEATTAFPPSQDRHMARSTEAAGSSTNTRPPPGTDASASTRCGVAAAECTPPGKPDCPVADMIRGPNVSPAPKSSCRTQPTTSQCRSTASPHRCPSNRRKASRSPTAGPLTRRHHRGHHQRTARLLSCRGSASLEGRRSCPR